ncbi:hypothetical protein ACOME3_008272 [Neoechinorhynchus agilis]
MVRDLIETTDGTDKPSYFSGDAIVGRVALTKPYKNSVQSYRQQSFPCSLMVCLKCKLVYQRSVPDAGSITGQRRQSYQRSLYDGVPVKIHAKIENDNLFYPIKYNIPLELPPTIEMPDCVQIKYKISILTEKFKPVAQTHIESLLPKVTPQRLPIAGFVEFGSIFETSTSMVQTVEGGVLILSILNGEVHPEQGYRYFKIEIENEESDREIHLSVHFVQCVMIENKIYKKQIDSKTASRYKVEGCFIIPDDLCPSYQNIDDYELTDGVHIQLSYQLIGRLSIEYSTSGGVEQRRYSRRRSSIKSLGSKSSRSSTSSASGEPAHCVLPVFITNAD